MAKDIETELREAFEIHPKGGEDRQKFLTRLMKAGKDCAEKTWESLTDPAQKWVNDAIGAYDDDKALPDPVKKAGSQRTENDDMATKPKAGKAGAKSGDKTAAAKKGGNGAAPTKKAAAKSGGSERKGPSKRGQIKALLVKNPATSVEKLIERFGGKGGLSDLSIQSMRSDTLNTLKVADEAGFWKGPKLPTRASAD